MAKFEKRILARELRRDGWSIRNIAKHLEVSKASASIWCRDLELTDVQKEKLFRMATAGNLLGRMKGAEANHAKKIARIEFHRQAGRELLGALSKREHLIAGIALYWAEGSRKSKMSFVNSEPKMIEFMYRWFQDEMGIKKEEFMPRIFINAIHEPRIHIVVKFWADLLELPLEQFGKPVLLQGRPKKIYENYDSYYGTLHLEVRKSTELKYKILGLIEAMKDWK